MGSMGITRLESLNMLPHGSSHSVRTHVPLIRIDCVQKFKDRFPVWWKTDRTQRGQSNCNLGVWDSGRREEVVITKTTLTKTKKNIIKTIAWNVWFFGSRIVVHCWIRKKCWTFKITVSPLTTFLYVLLASTNLTGQVRQKNQIFWSWHMCDEDFRWGELTITMIRILRRALKCTWLAGGIRLCRILRRYFIESIETKFHKGTFN